MNYERTLYLISIFIGIVPLTASLFGRAFNAQLKVLVFYFILSFTIEMPSNFPKLFHVADDSLWVHIYTILECPIILYIYYKEFNFKNPYPMLLLVAAFLIVAIHEFSRINYNSLATTFEAMIILPFTIVYFFKLSNNINIPKLTDFYFFWLNSAFLVYFSFTFLYFLFFKFVYAVPHTLGFLNSIGNIMYNILLTVTILKTRSVKPTNNTH